MTRDPNLTDSSKNSRVNTSGRGSIMFGLTLMFLLFVAGGAWAYLAKLSGAVIAQGQISVLGKPKTIQHLDGGIIAKINIDNGDKVEKGDVLIVLDETLLKANVNIYQSRIQDALAQRSRLIAERDEADNINWDDSVLKLLQVEERPSIKIGQRKLFDARLQTRLGLIDQLQEKINQYKNQLNGNKALKASKNTQLGFLEEELVGIRTLEEKGLTPKSQLMNLERQKEEIIGQKAQIEAQLATIQNSISETEIQILQINREFRQSVLTELREVEQTVVEVTQQLYATLERLRRVEIKAPVSGIIHELTVFTLKGVIAPGAAVLQIIPQGSGYEVEANIEPQFVDELFPGQPATLRFSAFNQRTTPELNGTVKDISPNVVVNEQTGISFYKIRVSVSTDEISRLNDQPLVPGMPVETFIKTRTRTALNYLTKPLMDQINRAFREE